MAAVDVIVREAGGMFTSLSGEDGPWGGKIPDRMRLSSVVLPAPR